MDEQQAVAAFLGLAQETRLKAFRRLIAAGPGGLAAGDLARALAVPAQTLSFHLKALEQAGLVTARREGRSILYAVALAGTRALIDYLVSDCCRGRPELCGFLEAEGAPPVCEPVCGEDAA